MMHTQVDEHSFSPYCMPFLNGQSIQDCLEVNEEEGWVEVFVREKDGHFQLNEQGTEIVREKRYGQVHITLSKFAPLAECQAYLAARRQGGLASSETTQPGEPA